MVTISRTIPGLGDAVMMEPAIRELSILQEVAVVTLYPDLFSGMYTVVDVPPPNATVINLGRDGYCPCAEFESHGEMGKGRIQIFLEKAGCEYRGQIPQITSPLGVAVKSLDEIRIGVSTYAGKYGDRIDGWRDYPYTDALIQELSKFSVVYWIHSSPYSKKNVIWVSGGIRHLITQIAALSLVLAVDNGIAHIAGALGIPLLGLFGPTDPRLRIAQYPNAHWTPEYKRCGRSYCWYEPCKNRYCLTTLRPQSIVARAKAILNI